MRLAALVVAVGLAASPAFATTVAEGVFSGTPLASVSQPTVFRYRFELSGSPIEEAYASPVRMEIREIEGDDKRVWFDMFEGKNQRTFGPMAAREQNPIVIVFLQRDVSEMHNLTGGSAGYFQQQIRRAFNDPAEVTDLEVEVDGRKVPATRLVIHPFRNDPRIDRFPRFREKAYEFVVSPEVPGGIYRVGTATPAPDGGAVLLAESMTFERVDSLSRAGASP